MSDDTLQASGWVCEIFTSIQGEGLFVGQRQTFIRLAGCNLACEYCDTASARIVKPDLCSVETAPGSAELENIKNPVSTLQVVDISAGLGAGVISVTGGEPLMQPEFLASLLPELKRNGFRVHLETNGLLHEELARVISSVDVVAMDIKLFSATGQETQWEEHRQFLEVANRTEVFAKVVASGDTSEDEIRRCARLIVGVNANIPLVIQPVIGDNVPTGELLLRLQSIASEYIDDVRVIPQCHKMLKIR